MVKDACAQVQGGDLDVCGFWGLGIMLLLCLPAWPAVPLHRKEVLPVFIYLPVIVPLHVASTHLPSLRRCSLLDVAVGVDALDYSSACGSCCPERVWNSSAGIAGYVWCCFGFLSMPPLCCCSSMALPVRPVWCNLTSGGLCPAALCVVVLICQDVCKSMHRVCVTSALSPFHDTLL